KSADALMQGGAKLVRAICTHPVLSGNDLKNIEKSKLDELLVCDTIPLQFSSSKIKVLSTAKLFSRAIRNAHEHRSISALYVDKKIEKY
ncbi:MAG: ribose-phosphate pyrophosphokinase, partial [bacterium]